MFCVVLCSCLVEVVRGFANAAKSQSEISFMFHPMDKDERLLSVANDIEVLNAKLRGIALERLENHRKGVWGVQGKLWRPSFSRLEKKHQLRN